ncbi:MAG: HAMP domain-containing histidine kinase [Acidobacteria bacterium]|nr:HAMP domain-containing histidine kinase [Acidobacteriota bacterium]
MPAFWWSLLNLLAWGFGLKAVLDLRAEWVPRAKTWFLVTQAVLSCLTMEAAMMGAAYLNGLAVLSSLTGVAAGILMWLAVRSLAADLRLDQTQVLRSPRNWDRVYAGVALAGAGGSIVLGLAMPRAPALAVAVLHPLEGAIWLVASMWILATLLTKRHTGSGAQMYAPRAMATAFVFAFGESAVTPFARLTGVPVLPQVPTLLRTLFILVFVTTLYGTVIRVRSHKLMEALKQLRGAQDQLFAVEKMAAVSTLAAGAAHDFNNSLMAILGHLALAREDEGLSRETREDLEHAEKAAKAAAVITANLLGVARHHARRGACRTLRDVVQMPLDMLRHDLRRHNIDVVTHLDDVPCGAADPSLISQVCLNLYLNARDAMVPKGGGTLDVSLAVRDGEVEIAVRDTGVGIPADFRPRMFQPLQTTKGERGTGLGLSTSQSVVASMGGRITYETEAQQGTTFRVHLPAHHGPVMAGPEELSSASPG